MQTAGFWNLTPHFWAVRESYTTLQLNTLFHILFLQPHSWSFQSLILAYVKTFEMLAYMYDFISRILIRSPQMLAIPEIRSLKPTDFNYFKVKLTQLSEYTHILKHTHTSFCMCLNILSMNSYKNFRPWRLISNIFKRNGEK